MHHIRSGVIILLLLSTIVALGIIASHGTRNPTGATTIVVACYEDADCNDRIQATEDICRNPGTEYSLCVNKPKKES